MTGELPQGWAVAKLEQLVSPDGLMTDGDWVESKDQDPSGDVRLLQLADVGAGEFRDRSNRFLTSSKAKDLNCTFLRPGDVLIARLGDVLGKACLAPKLSQPSVTVVDVHVFRSGHPDVSHRWLMHLFNAQATQRALEELSSGTTRKRVTGQKLKDLEVRVPPANEQQRIVSRIEELFSEIDEGERALERVGRLVERYRQSVLKAAVTGELTREWRAAAGSAASANEGDSLPGGWTSMRAEDVCGFITKGTTPPASSMRSDEGAIPYVKVYNLTLNGALDFSMDPTFIDEATHRGVLARSIVKPGDVLMNIVGPPLGKVSIVPATHAEWNMNQAVCVFRPRAGLHRQFLAYYLLSRVAQDWLASRAKASVGQVNLTLQICRDLPVPIPPLAEQLEIVERVASKLASLDSMTASMRAEVSRSGALRQSILKAAFSGQLVPQDPRDEPAAALLARLAAQSAGAPTAPKRRGRPPRQPAAAL